MFAIRKETSQVCDCGERADGVSEQGSFGERVNVAELQKLFEVEVSYSPLKPEAKIRDLVGKFVTFVKSSGETWEDGCVADNPTLTKAHRRRRVSSIRHAPEVYSFNLSWPLLHPKSSLVLETMISLPEKFDLKELASSEGQSSVVYTLKGLVCYSNNHYFAFFRRIFHKIGYVVGSDHKRAEAVASLIKHREIQSHNEWLLFNDDSIATVTDNWPGVIQMCL